MNGSLQHHQQQGMPQGFVPSTGAEARPGAWTMGAPMLPHAYPANQQAAAYDASSDQAYMGYSRAYNAPPAVYGASPAPLSAAYGGNPYVQVDQSLSSSGKGSVDTFLKALGRCGKKLEYSTRKAGSSAGNVWHHLKTSPNLTDAAMGRLAVGTKVLAEGGYDKVFQKTFGMLPGEQLRKSYACHLSTTSGPVIGTLYLSNMRLAFSSDNPLSYSPTPGKQEMMYYKVIVQFNQLTAVIPSASRMNPSERYIQLLTTDGHEFWFMGFVSYDKALKNLTEALPHYPAH